MIPSRVPSIVALLALSCLLGLVAGCQSQRSAQPSISEQKPAPASAMLHGFASLKAELAADRVDEAGVVPVLEFHEIVSDGARPHNYQYRISDFRAIMERMYADNYRPINLTELVTGHIDCAIGASPFVITFDDALPGQIDYTRNGAIDPDCAVGVLLAMHAQHPDWRLAGTFFVLPAKGRTDYFYQPRFSRAKLNWLVAHGFELGNHTVHHLRGIRSWPDARVESEFAIAAKMIDDNVPGYKVDLLALPFGVYPRKLSLVERGSYDGIAYANICAMRAGSAPAVSPVTREWNPYRIQRIIPGDGYRMIGYWLSYLDSHHAKRYISDGDPGTITVPAKLASQVLPSQLKKLGLTLRTY